VSVVLSSHMLAVVLSSHMLAELERVADYLVLIARGRVRLQGQVQELLASHRLLTGPSTGTPVPADWEVIESRPAGAQTHQLVRLPSSEQPLPPAYQARPVGVEELAMGYLRETAASQQPTLTGAAR
jgi:ABC-2 type transport system ATP-binding protein